MAEDETQAVLPTVIHVDWGRGYVQNQEPLPDPAALLQVYEAALKRIAARTEYGDAVVREVGLKTASDIAREALAWKK